MKRFAAFVVLLMALLQPLSIKAQQAVQALVPQQAVTIGNAFQVQYVVYDLQHFEYLQTPDFNPDFQLVSGPVFYSGNIIKKGRPIPVHNFSFTLVPLRKGKLTIPGATLVYSHKKQVTLPAFVNCTDAVVTKPVQQPGGMLSQDAASGGPVLMVKATVDKNECYVGEPLVATFTLLSKIVTAAEVIKNPGFYGFSVADMPRSAPQTAENSNPAGYEKHLLRKVQLYPMQPGKLSVDEMTVHNLVQTMDASGNAIEEELVLNSVPLTINVKPLPAQTVKSFTGAVGQFDIKAKLTTKEVIVGRTGKLQVTLSGAGNFLQLANPEVAWPAHVEGFEPHVLEDLKKYLAPIAGIKQYEYSFTADSAGNYAIPPIALTYFNPQTKKYITTTTDSLHFTAVPQKGFKTILNKEKKEVGSSAVNWMIIPAVALALLAVLLLFFKMQKTKKTSAAGKQSMAPATPTFTEQLKLLNAQQKDFKGFYKQLQRLVLQFLKSDYNITPNTKVSLQQQLTLAPFTNAQKEALLFILEECESVQYYNATPSISFKALQCKAIEVVSQLEKEK